MATITIYKVTCHKGYKMSDAGANYSYEPWGHDTPYFEGWDDGGKVYDLPEGYTAGKMQGGTPGVWRYNPRTFGEEFVPASSLLAAIRKARKAREVPATPFITGVA